MDLATFLMRSPDLGDRSCVTSFTADWAPRRVKKGAFLARQEDPDPREHILLDGNVVSSISDPDGRDVCVGLSVGPCVITPNLARTREGVSLVTMQATTDAVVAQIDSDTLTDLMLVSEPIRNWANGILRAELGRKVDREWCLAALGGADRLTWFRERYPGYEAIFGHALIASFLGVSPVTFSRLRNSD